VKENRGVEVVKVVGEGGDALSAPLDTTVVVPTLIRIPLISVGNLLDRHLCETHSQTHSPPPPCSKSLTLSENGHNGVDGLKRGKAAD